VDNRSGVIKNEMSLDFYRGTFLESKN